MSPRAAWRLETFGFDQVYDYVGGKADWLAAGLPSEGTATAELRASDAARRDVPICRIEDDLDAVRSALGDWDTCLVVNEEGVLLGRLGGGALSEAAAGARAEDAMTEGPSTVRPNAPLTSVVERMQRHGLGSYPVTTSDGRLVGLIVRDEAERRLASHA